MSSWSEVSIPPEGETGEWPPEQSYEDAGMSFRALNDASVQILLISASAKEGRFRLTGEARQDIELWFLRADGKTRDWAVRWPYARDASAEPELLTFVGTAVSSSSLPTDLAFRRVASGRRPIWELKLPRSRLSPGKGGFASIDLSFLGKGRSQDEILLERAESSEDAAASSRRRRDRRRRADTLEDESSEMGPSTLHLALCPAEPPAAAK